MLEYRSVDNASQVETTKSVQVKIDRLAPVTTASVSEGTVTLSATDATSGVLAIGYRVDNGTWMVYTGEFTLTAVGTHMVDFYAVDNAGNTETTQTVTVVVEEPEEEPGLASNTLIWIGLGAAAAVAALLVLFLLMRRRKGQGPVAMVPGQAEVVPPEQGPPAPPA